MKLNKVGVIFLLFGCIFSSIIINLIYVIPRIPFLSIQLFNENISFIFLNIGFYTLGVILILKDFIHRGNLK